MTEQTDARPQTRRKQLDIGPAEIEFGAFWPRNITSRGVEFTDFPENQLTTVYAYFCVCLCSFHVHES